VPARSLEGLVTLHRLQSREERAAALRQGLATLARAAADQAPAPLEGLPPESLQQSIRIALEERLLDDLAWLSPAAAAVALYELAAALPMGTERRALGRRVLAQLHEGDAATFVAVATALATGSRRGLVGPGIRARVALALDLPIGTGTRADALALALISRRDLAREWLSLPSTGALPSRRLAARLLERAAREAALRASQGDDGAVRPFQAEWVRTAWSRLLADRESLVWRHVATARGLLAHVLPAFAEDIDRDLGTKLTPTEWRRAAASTAAAIAFRPDDALARTRAILGSEIVRRDPGVAGAMIFGLPRAAETEPRAAEEVLEALVRAGGLYGVESLVELHGERIAEGFGEVAAQIARTFLRGEASRAGGDDGHAALVDVLHDELSAQSGRAGATLRARIAHARLAFAEKGAREAHRRAREVLGAAQASLATLERTQEVDTEGRRRAFGILRDLDVGLFETSALHDLLLLGAKDDQTESAIAPLDEIHDRLAAVLVEREREPLPSDGKVPHPTLRLRRLRTLLHLVDSEGPVAEGSGRATAQRERRLAAAHLLLDRAANDPPSTVRRTVCAALARVGDALVRDEVWEISDLVLAAATRKIRAEDLSTIAEASMEPDIEASIEAWASLLRRAEPGRSGEVRLDARLQALAGLSRALPTRRSPRTEALRGALLRFSSALQAVSDAHSLAALAEGSALEQLEASAQSLALLTMGARRRLGEQLEREEPRTGAAIRWLHLAVERTLRGVGEGIAQTLPATERALREELPPAIADVAMAVLSKVGDRPAEAPAPILLTRKTSAGEPPLPPWLPPSRTLGGFYVVRPIGAGAVGTVFVAKRAEERNEPAATRFALKVPRFDGDAARLLTEEQFDQLFRDEAGALLSVPSHPNLARFVTFDAGARPKPILVMELVEGPTLERVIEGGDLDVRRAFDLLDGIAAGLETMHKAGVGHLDVKPSNVILRDPDGRGPERGRPVLVDFGLAGRNLRPGCATAAYGAPEVWGLVPEGHSAVPAPADAYAFGCVAFEIMTRRPLFSAANEIAMVSSHVGHDGAPAGIPELARGPSLRPLAELLSRCLRRDPRARTSIPEIRAGLAKLAPTLASQSWPLPA